MTDNDKITIELNIQQTNFISQMVGNILLLKDRESDYARMIPPEIFQVAQEISSLLVDAAILEGKISIEDLPPLSDEDLDLDE